MRPTYPLTVGDVLTPEVRAQIMANRDALGLEWQPTGRYYCVRCHRAHEEWSAIGQRHAVNQPLVMRATPREGGESR